MKTLKYVTHLANRIHRKTLKNKHEKYFADDITFREELKKHSQETKKNSLEKSNAILKKRQDISAFFEKRLPRELAKYYSLAIIASIPTILMISASSKTRFFTVFALSTAALYLISISYIIDRFSKYRVYNIPMQANYLSYIITASAYIIVASSLNITIAIAMMAFFVAIAYFFILRDFNKLFPRITAQ